MRWPVRAFLACTMIISMALAGCTTVVSGNPQSRTARADAGPVEPVAGHPRLFIREGDVERLRSWATPANPLWQDGLVALATRAKATMDDGTVPAQDGGSADIETYPTELYAQLFAFMSLIDPDEQARTDYGHRARDLLMYVIDKAAAGAGAEGDPFRDPRFATFNRSRWSGASFATTVDWAYPYFSPQDRAQVRQVFLRWADEQFTAYPAAAGGGGATDFTRAGDTPDPALLADELQLRWSTNNYFTGHGRNLVLMSLAMDPVDDPDGQLSGYLRQALNLWWYQTDQALRGDAAGGLSPEGTEYAQSSIAYMTQLGFALHTAGQDDPARNGPQSVLGDNPFFGQLLPAQLHAVAPEPTPADPELEIGGPVFLPASYGDFERYVMPDLTEAMVPWGLYALDRGDRATYDAMRWYITNVSPGGAEQLVDRVGNTDQFFTSMLYFMALDPNAPPPADPRPQLPLAHASPGMHRYSARTCWCPDASWFTYALTWKSIDHQGSDGNEFELYRKGEWLTKKHTGYDTPWYTDYHNTLTIENNPPVEPLGDPYDEIAARGSQEPLSSPTDPTLVAQGQGEGWFYALGDATPLYNWQRDGRTDVTHASRSIVWLQPDHVVVYDRAQTATPGRFKRFWLQLPTQANVAGDLATAQTPGGQQLFNTTLLPADAVITSAESAPIVAGVTAVGEPMHYQLQVDAPGGPASVRFLNVVQGADGGVAADPATLVESTGGRPYTGAAVAGTLAVFPVDVGAEIDTTTVPVPGGVTRVLVTGLAPNGGYDVSSGGGQVTVTRGGSTPADASGVLVIAP